MAQSDAESGTSHAAASRWPHAYVTACLWVELLRHTTVNQMIAWTVQPKQLPKLPFGKHRGLSWAQAPLDYLQWMMRQTDMDQSAV